MDNKKIRYLTDENGNPVYCDHIDCVECATCYVKNGIRLYPSCPKHIKELSTNITCKL